MSGRGLRCDRRADQVGNGLGQRPQPRPVDVNEAFVTDLLAVEEPADDVDALNETLVAHLLARPPCGDSFVGGFAGSEGRPESAWEHLRECRDRLGHYRGVVALPGCVDDPERQLVVASAAPRKDQAKPDSP